MNEKRAFVAEHRITRSLYNGRTIRYWIETDPDFGGESRESALQKIVAREEYLDLAITSMNEAELAEAFLNAVPSANSVEVCDNHGNGTAVHRDWP